jgi:leucyl/phenylalanyl-tRNA---protein transferase
VRFGAHEIPRREFLERLAKALEEPMLRGRWEYAPPPLLP